MTDFNQLLQPDQRRRLGQALMTQQFDRPTPQDSAVTERATMLPFGTYENGQTALAIPGLLTEPVEAFNRLMQNGYQSGDARGAVDGFNVAGAAMMGGLAAPRPRGSLGMSGRPEQSKGMKLYRGNPDGNNPALNRWYTTDINHARNFGEVAEYNANFSKPAHLDWNDPAYRDLFAGGGHRADGNLYDIANDMFKKGTDAVIIKNHPENKKGTVVLTKDALDQLYANGGRPGAALGAALTKAEQPKGITAYHGSPHDFDRFDMSRIGTGEGAQAYGHGLYFAEAEAVAKRYRDELAGEAQHSLVKFKDKPQSELANTALAELNQRHKSDGDTIEAYIAKRIKQLERRRDAQRDDAIGSVWRSRLTDYINEIKSWHPDALEAPSLHPGGRMYEVNINAHADDFLDWDKPFSANPKAVAFAEQHGISPHADTGAAFTGAVDSKFAGYPATADGRAKAAMALSEAGIPGIKYLDQGSRTAGEGSRNYVVFDENLINILRKYGLMGMVGGEAANAMMQNYGQPSQPKPQPRIPDDAA